MFKKRRGIKLSYIKQGLICFTCLDYKDQPQEIKDKIVNLCNEVGGEYRRALFEVMTNEHATIRSVARRFFLSETTLYELRKDFFEKWYKKGMEH